MSNSDSPEGSTSPIRQWTELGQYTELSDHMSVKELSLWLKTVGEIPDTFCQIIADNYIDGKEFMNLSEQEVKKIIPAIGIVKKIMRLIPKNNISDSSPPVLAPESPGQASNDTLILSSGSESSHGSGNLSGDFVIPSHWRPEVVVDKREPTLYRQNTSYPYNG